MRIKMVNSYTHLEKAPRLNEQIYKVNRLGEAFTTDTDFFLGNEQYSVMHECVEIEAEAYGDEDFDD